MARWTFCAKRSAEVPACRLCRQIRIGLGRLVDEAAGIGIGIGCCVEGRGDRHGLCLPYELAAQKVERAPEHLPRYRDDVEIGLVGTLRLAHVDCFDQRIDVGVLHIAALVGGGVARLEPRGEGALVQRHLANLDDAAAHFGIIGGFERPG